MVFFVCEACNETLKKNQVDKHCYSCRRCEAVTCVDCQVTFYGDDYKAHMVCVSEAEKYEKSLFKGKKEKVDPQAVWMDLIAECAARSDASQNVRRILERIADVGNVPRNKKKFGNFIKNSMKIYADGPIEETWNYLEKARNDASGPSETASAEPPTQEASVEETESKKRKLDEAQVTDAVEEETKKKKKKSKKKQSSREAEESVEDSAEEVEVVEKKKKKKKKTEEVEEDTADSAVVESEEASEKKKTKKKKKDKK